MRYILAMIICLLSLSAFAVDLYLVCEDSKNDVLLTTAINNGNTKMVVHVSNEVNLELRLSQLRDEDKSLFYLGVTNLKSVQSDNVHLSLFQEVTIGHYLCAARD
jgi:hypothetical protein